MVACEYCKIGPNTTFRIYRGSRMGPKWQKSSFWARDLKFTLYVHFHDWWDCLKKHSMVPKKDPNGPKMGPKWVQKWQKSSFWARDLKFTPDICYYNWWKELDSKLPKVNSMVPKKGPKGSKNGSKIGLKITKIKFFSLKLEIPIGYPFS